MKLPPFPDYVPPAKSGWTPFLLNVLSFMLVLFKIAIKLALLMCAFIPAFIFALLWRR